MLNYFRIGGVVLAIVAISFLLHTVNHAFNQSAKVPGLNIQITTLQEALKLQSERLVAANKLTQTVSQNYEDTINSRNTELVRLRKRPATCVPVQFTSAANSLDATHQPNKPGNTNGVSSSFLVDYAGDCEGDRAKVIGLQDFVTKLYKLNTQ